MGKSKRIKLMIVILLLGGVSLFIRIKPTITPGKPEIFLSEYLKNIGEWEYVQDIYLSENTIKALDLDDYLHRIYKSADNYISLYIGYYYSNNKIGAAHSPLVCFPGQGWKYTYKKDIIVYAGIDTLNIASLLISKGDEKQMVLYWFQAYDKTSSNTILQKINLFLSKIINHSESNAFVRIIIPMNEYISEDKATQIGIEFIRSFYPHFKNYLIIY